MFTLNHVQKKYGSKIILNDINLDFKSGQFIALLGKNGSGKSTAMRLLAKSELVTKGEILFNSVNLNSPSIELNSEIAFISDSSRLPERGTVKEWIDYFRLVYPKFDEERLKDLLSELDIEPNQAFSEYSRGQKVKLLFAINACKTPKVYILDEITSVLDSGSRFSVMRFLQEESKKGCLIIISSNIIFELQGFATDICFLENNKIKLYMPVDVLNEKYYKFRIEKDISVEKLNTVLGLGAKLVKINSDSTSSLIIEKESEASLTQNYIIPDRREITLEEISNYLTT